MGQMESLGERRTNEDVVVRWLIFSKTAIGYKEQ